MIFSDDKELKAALEKWQHLLGLDAWVIRASIVRQMDMDDPDAEGHSNIVFSRRAALITILDPVDYPSDAIVEQDMEQTLVHELLHLCFEGFAPKEDSMEYTLMEQEIDMLATTLVCLNRETA